MGKSDRLRLKDVCAVLRLIGECRELGRDPLAWRQHMVDGLRRLTGAQVALHMQLRDLGSNAERIIAAFDAGFLDASQRALWAQYQRENAQRDDPFHLSYYRGFTGALRTRSLRSVVDGSVWERSRHYNDFVRACNLDDRITSSFSLQELASQTTHVLVLHRAAPDGEFGARMRHVVHMFNRELRPLVGQNLALVSAAEELSALPLQLQRVLGCLLQGDGEKQVADRLGISPHTVNRHVQRLYRRFGVNTRGELLCRCRDVPSRFPL